MGILVIWGVSGVYFCFPAIFRAGINWISPISFMGLPHSTPPAGLPPQPLPVDLVVGSSHRYAPQELLIGVIFPAGPKGAYTLMYSSDYSGEFSTADYFYFDQYNGHLLNVWHRGINKTAGDLILSWMAPLHFGTFGSVPVKIVWVVLGLSLPALFVTGALMWWNRVLHHEYRLMKRRVLRGRVVGSVSTVVKM
jgi:uncharacterized iron-regulated membrane protein